MEVSSHALALRRVDGVGSPPRGFTNLAPGPPGLPRRHRGLLPGQGLLFDGRARAASVVAVDDEAGRRLAGRPGVPVPHDRLRPDADWRRPVDGRRTAATFTLHGPAASARTGAAAGRFNVANAVLAVATLVPSACRSTPRRGRRRRPVVPGPHGARRRADAAFVAVVDYAHTPDAVATALAALRPSTAGRLITVARLRRRPRPGQAARDGRGRRRAAATSSSSPTTTRVEDPAAIRAAMLAGVARRARRPARRGARGGDRRAAIARRRSRAGRGPGDTLLVAGKGHETGQEVAGTVHPFDDREVLARSLARCWRGRRVIPLTPGRGRPTLTGGEARPARSSRASGRRHGHGHARLPRVGPATCSSPSPGERVDGHDFLAARRGRRRRRRAGRPGPDDAPAVRRRRRPVAALGRLAAGVHDRGSPGCGRWRSPAPPARPRPRTCSASVLAAAGPTVARPAPTTTRSACR